MVRFPTTGWSLGLMPGAVHATLDRKAEDSLAEADAVEAAVMSGDDGPAVLAYADTPQLVRAAYPWLQMGLQMVSRPVAATKASRSTRRRSPWPT